MAVVTRILLDVLKPHDPSVLDLARALGDLGDYRVCVRVLEMDKKTETLEIEVAGADVDFEAIHTVIRDLGAALHSVDEVDVSGSSVDQQTE
ncbi:DUF211 domain-containing protein [Marinobacterium rhizophilum]|uniref:DUF211 domain-containing protein n=1 Tax=Marinobacterium rhizophilum TaxID=420402 RepID=UPI0003761B45|nr:DUF211 domain-containing protein [Marinobacterium rhizophilum]